MVEAEHLYDWALKLFGKRPLHSGLAQEQYWKILRESLSEVKEEIPEEFPE